MKNRMLLVAGALCALNLVIATRGQADERKPQICKWACGYNGPYTECPSAYATTCADGCDISGYPDCELQ